MNSPERESEQHKIAALWTAVIIEGLVIIAVGAYNIYEIRRTSEHVQQKIEGLSEFSVRQGEKLDRMVSALELYADTRFATNTTGMTNIPVADQRIDKAIEFLEAMKKAKEAKQ